MSVEIGKKVKAFSAKASNDLTVKSSALKGQIVVLYFYPKDSTPGCTTEAQNFRDNLSKFKRAGAVVFGISRDSLSSHERFKEKQGLNFELIADPDEVLCQQFDVIKEKNMYGKKVIGIERSTFIIDPDGKLAHEWRKIKVAGHVDEVLAAVKALAKAAK